MAVGTILDGLALLNKDIRNRSLLNKYRSVDGPYDVVIRINSLEDLQTHGWEITLKKYDDKNMLIDRSLICENGAIVAIVGAYNRGKTFLLSELCNVNFRHDKLIHTEGISITAGKENYTNIVFMDTAGTDTPVVNEKLQYKRATEAFLREVVVHLCSVVIIVVNRLRATDQIYINKILEHCKDLESKKYIMIVHNLNDVETIDDIDKVIENEVKTIFAASENERQFVSNRKTKSVKFFCSNWYNFQLNHFILAKKGSSAAKKWNVQSLDGIMNILQAYSQQGKTFDIINTMIHFMNTRLTQLLIDDLSQNKIQLVQHETRPFLVLADRKQMTNLEESPRQLMLSEKLFYDDAGCFVKGCSNLWQPRYTLCENEDTIFAILELPGVTKSDRQICLSETCITVKGVRNRFIDDNNTLVTHVSDIASGQFELLIQLKSPVDITNYKTTYQDGLIKIEMQKKKPTVIEIEES